MSKKYIFDFDDVLFNNTKQFKKHMFKCVADAGVPDAMAREYYDRQEVRSKEFSLRSFITTLFAMAEIISDQQTMNELYANIMKESPKFVNRDVIGEILRVGIANCYIITNGEREFNTDKLKHSGVLDLFGGNMQRIRIVPKEKKEAIEGICAMHPNEDFVFVDNRQEFLDEVKDMPRIKTILFDENGLEKLRALIPEGPSSEFKRPKR